LDVVFVVVGAGEWFISQSPAQQTTAPDDEETP